MLRVYRPIQLNRETDFAISLVSESEAACVQLHIVSEQKILLYERLKRTSWSRFDKNWLVSDRE